MNLDLDLYRREVRVSSAPRVRLSVIDVCPEQPRRTFVFIHGFGGDASQWDYQLQHFLIENRVIAPDLRGHGLSDKPARGYELRQILSDLEILLSTLKLQKRIVLVGHSFGGAIATEFALAHPDWLDDLILIATPRAFQLRPLFRFGLALPNPLLRVGAVFFRKRLGAPPRALKPFYLQSLANWDGSARFSSLQVPTLVIRGHRDQVFERSYFDDVTRSIPGAVEADIGSSGHLVMLERHEAVNRAIQRFVEGEHQGSWRAGSSRGRGGRSLAGNGKVTSREMLKAERPWLAQYEQGVPYTTAVPEIPLHHLLRSAVRRFPSHPAILYEGSQLTYRFVNHEANRFANALQSLGIGKGTRVALLLPNVPQMVIGFYGTLKAGAAAVLIPPTIEPGEIIRQVCEAEPSLLVTLTDWAGLAEQVRRSSAVSHIVLTNGAEYLAFWKRWVSRWRTNGLTVQNALSWHRWLAGQSRQSPTVEVAPEDLAALQYTGGTTARAKGVMLSHRNLVANALQTRHWMPHAQEGRERFLSVVPFFHSYGLTTSMNVPVALGAAMILRPQFQTLDVLRAIQHYKPTIFTGVPSMYVALNNFRGVRKYGIQSIRACISGSAPLPLEVQETFERLTKGRLVEGYGLTEASPVTHANPLGSGGKRGTIGVPIPSTEATILDLARGRTPVRPGQVGELAVRGPQVMIGYWKDAAATAKVMRRGGWLLTGDVAQQDRDGYFRIIARKADMWYPAKPGKPAFPRDVEEVIYEIPQVKEVAVTAIAGTPLAFIIPERERPSPEAVIAYCKRRLPPNLVPRFVFFMDDFPRTFIGKVMRHRLVKLMQERAYGEQDAVQTKVWRR